MAGTEAETDAGTDHSASCSVNSALEIDPISQSDSRQSVSFDHFQEISSFWRPLAEFAKYQEPYSCPPRHRHS
jgi:hypothetical protein